MRYKQRISVCTVVLLLSFQVQAFQFKDAAGELHKLEDYKGRWVLVNFWATWCPPCLKEIPDLISLYEDRKDIMVIGVAMDSDPQEIMNFVRSLSINYPIVLGDREIASQLDEISLLPSTYFYDPDGNPAARQLGIISRESIEKFIESKSTEKNNTYPN
ncbi:TlpA disulfide reductase family protein [uncultured Nitrosomonas sp.]|uniref:TlpA family protein disulfide reductase n=1 Tax=uncultured Nitrosomonas sp. TaxID=156424 RepID=UPI0025D7032C|nr:TlpA disulfide reductase family protein [uncultured Nitrosomonas sp.]